MSNSFPAMISNEPPPLDQTDDEDEDSEEFRDFASGLKLDVDPSPMSTPRKEGSGSSLPVHNGRITPDNGLDSKESSTNPSPYKTPSSEVITSPVKSSILLNCSTTALTSCTMKTSYIGTLEPDPVECESEIVPEVNGLQGNVSVVELTVPPYGNEEASQDSCQVDENDFDDFQDFQTSSIDVDEREVMELVKTEDSVEIEASEEECGKDDKSGSESLFSTPILHEKATVQDISSKDESFPEESVEEKLELAEPLTTVHEKCLESELDIETMSEPNEVKELGIHSSISELNKLQQNEADQTLKSAVENVTDESTIFSSQVPEHIVNEVPETSSKSVLLVDATSSNSNISQADSGFTADFGGFNDVDEFEDFQISPPINSTASSSSCVTSDGPSVDIVQNQVDNDKEFPDFQAHFPSVESSSSAPPIPHGGDDEDDFDDFQDFQSTPTPAAAAPESNVQPRYINDELGSQRRSSLLQSKFETLVKTLFIGNGGENVMEEVAAPKPIDKKLKEEDDGGDLWNRIEDFEGSQGLVFKWLDSVAHQRLLQSLKIDNSTIVYTGKWGPIEIPRFAASLVETPLQPESITATNGITGVTDDVPEVKEVGGSTPGSLGKNSSHGSDGILLSANKIGKSNGRVLSREAEQILNQLPDLSFMRAKTLVFPKCSTSQAMSSDV